MAKQGLSVNQTKGTFEARGIVFGTNKDTFYTEKKTKDGKRFWRNVNFGIQISKEETIYVQFNGMEQDAVYFYGKTDKDAKKGETIKVEWKDRFTFKRENFRLIGVNCGLEKTLDKDGKEVNDKRNLHPFDAAKYVSENLMDGFSVFVKGNIEYSSFTNQKGESSHSTKYVPNQISLCKDIDFEVTDMNGEPYETVANFTQPLVFMGIEKAEEEGKFVLQAKIVNYSTIEDAEFVIEDQKLATNFRKNLKPYTFISTWGNIRTVKNTDTVEAGDDGWGNPNPMNRVFAPYKVLRVICGADPTSIDKDAYSEEKMELALEEAKKMQDKEKAFESPTSEDWGGTKKPTAEEDSPWD